MASVSFDTAEPSQTFVITEGGPGAAMMRRLHLVRPEQAGGLGRTALILVAVTWVPLFVLCLLEGLAFGRVTIPFMYDIAAHARFLLAVPVLVLADLPVGARIGAIIGHFLVAHLVRDEDVGKFEQIVRDGLWFRDSDIGEIIVLAVTYLAPSYFHRPSRRDAA